VNSRFARLESFWGFYFSPGFSRISPDLQNIIGLWMRGCFAGDESYSLAIPRGYDTINENSPFVNSDKSLIVGRELL